MKTKVSVETMKPKVPVETVNLKVPSETMKLKVHVETMKLKVPVETIPIRNHRFSISLVIKPPPESPRESYFRNSGKEYTL